MFFYNKGLNITNRQFFLCRKQREVHEYVSFPWPPLVAAHDRNGITQALHNSRSFGSGETFLIPGIQLCLFVPAIPFKRRRRCFSIKIVFTVAINEAQGQTLIPVAIYLPSSVFPMASSMWNFLDHFNPLNPELNPICYLLALLGAHHFLHVSRKRVRLLTFRLLMSYIYGAPILDVSRSHTTTQHSR